MNEPNVAALRALLDIHASTAFEAPFDGADLAEWLARHGVLVPSALTEEDVESANFRVEVGRYEVNIYRRAQAVAYFLERIAKGEL